MAKATSVSNALLSDLLTLHRLSEKQSMILASILIGSASGEQLEELALVHQKLVALRSRLDGEHARERWNLTLSMGLDKG